MVNFFALILIILGLIIIFLGIIGLFRMPDFFSKLHAASIIDTTGVIFCLTGLCFFQSNLISTFKIIFIICLIILLGPLASHSLAKAALFRKLKKYNIDDKP